MVDIRMGDQRGTTIMAIPTEYIDGAFRDPSAVTGLGNEIGGNWRQLRRFQDYRVGGREGAGDGSRGNL